MSTIVRGHGQQKKKNSKNNTKILRNFFLKQRSFLHGGKENFEKYSLILEYAEWSFPILNNFDPSREERPCPRATVI